MIYCQQFACKVVLEIFSNFNVIPMTFNEFLGSRRRSVMIDASASVDIAVDQVNCRCTSTKLNIRNAAVAKKTDRTANDVQHCCRTEPPKVPRLE